MHRALSPPQRRSGAVAVHACETRLGLTMACKRGCQRPLVSRCGFQVTTIVRCIEGGITRQARAYQDQNCWLHPLSPTVVTDDASDTTFGKLSRRKYI
jgi:hypothetical protein